jgi:uncharacterized iron-regulated protein
MINQVSPDCSGEETGAWLGARNVCVAILLASLLAACAQAPTQEPAVRNASVLLLGEVHDNAEGHRQRLAVLESRLKDGWRPAIAMEQFDRDRQDDLDQAMQRCADAECVRQAAGDKDWQWEFYLPVITLAQRYKLPLLAANLSRRDATHVVMEGFPAAFDAAAMTQWHLDQPIPADIADAQKQEIIEGHCNKLPVSLIGGMLQAQIARDVWMARVITPYASGGVVLLAGNGHVRKDIGVPRWLSLPTGRVVSVGFVESAQEASAYDFIRQIPAQERGDPCAGL